MKRHIGKMANTDQRLVVVFMQIPDREDHALVIPTDTLPARYEQAVMEILESTEGQAEESLANILSRRLMPDTGKPVLQALHDGNMLKAVPIANILMMPMPNMPFPLQTVLEGMGRNIPKTVNPTSGYNPAVEKYNRRAIAQNLLIEAEMLQNEANKKREAAYTAAPELRPAPTSYSNSSTAPVIPVKAPKTAKPKFGIAAAMDKKTPIKRKKSVA
jgi:hypothetical protein